MPIYRPQELFTFLHEEKLSPKKGLSQNFLIDGNIIRKIADSAALKKGDAVLEIGPGPGALTEELLNRGSTVLAIEKDEGFAKSLKRLQSFGNLTILKADVLEVDLEKALAHAGMTRSVKVISNIPYHITTPIIIKLLAYQGLFSCIIVMVQEEVARRFTAIPKTKDYSSISIFLSFFADVRYGFKVTKNCFMPSPKVDSAIIFLYPKRPPLAKEEEQKQFLHFVRTAFNQRRKTLRSALQKLYSKDSMQEALIKISLNPSSRAEELSLEEFLLLFHTVSLIEKKKTQ